MTSRPHRVLAIGVAVIVLIAVVAAVVSATRSDPTYGEGTPERTVQRFLTAALDGDYEASADLLVEDSSCDVEDFDQAYVPDDVRVVLHGTDVEADRSARVRVEVVFGGGDPFGGSEYSEDQSFRLTKSGGEWLIEGVPWPLYECGTGR